MYVCMYVCMHACMYVCIYVCIIYILSTNPLRVTTFAQRAMRYVLSCYTEDVHRNNLGQFGSSASGQQRLAPQPPPGEKPAGRSACACASAVYLNG